MPHQDYYVYILFRETGLPFYVGMGRGHRWKVHEQLVRYGRDRNSNFKKYKIIRDMLTAGWRDIPKIKIVEHLNHAQACACEIAWIAILGRDSAGFLVNRTDGGDNGATISADTRAKISAANLGRMSADGRAKIAAANRKRWLGRKHSTETLAKMRIAHRARNSASAETRAKLRKIACNRSTETLAKMSAAKRGRKLSLDTRAKMSAAQRKRRQRAISTNSRQA